MKPYIIVASMRSYDRPTLEKVENDSFNNIEEVYKRLKELDPQVKEMPSIVPLYEFTTDWNDTDDSGKYVSPMDTFISYVYIEN